MTACYLDASALVKLATREAETDALREQVAQFDRRVSSRLVTVEVPRALARRGPDSVRAGGKQLGKLVEALYLVELDASVTATAAGLQPATLRSLDAIHLASALAVRDELDVLLTYDARLADAARAAGLEVVAPS